MFYPVDMILRIPCHIVLEFFCSAQNDIQNISKYFKIFCRHSLQMQSLEGGNISKLYKQ